MTTDSTILAARDLAIGYDSKIIGRAINLTVKPGQLICLLGQNGVGKSTLLRTLAMTQPALGGQILLHGKSPEDMSSGELARQLGIVTTEKVGVPAMTVRELVGLGRYPYTNWLGRLSANDHSKVEEAITRCRINYIADKRISDLSDGQRQKAMIARVLAQDTDVILLDEPTAHLDLINRVEVMKLLHDIKKDKCIVVSTHELALSMQFADQFWLMHFNAAISTGAPEDLAWQGKLSRAFYQDDFQVDVLTGKVVTTAKQQGLVALNADEPLRQWGEHALHRAGYGLAPSANCSVELMAANGEIAWCIDKEGKKRQGQTLAALLDVLQSLEVGQ